ncbi:MAG: hypothetical protein HZA69_02415 [Gammaproteobacteria bacterium]|nr:hypothetical protein [Gammaproteobacteria bacterium]
MAFPKTLMISGYVIAGCGALVAAVFDQRIPGAVIFAIGFYAVVVGVIASIFSKDYQDRVANFGVGLKIGAVGFAICSLSFLVAILKTAKTFENILFYGGLATVVIGIFLITLNVVKRN